MRSRRLSSALADWRSGTIGSQRRLLGVLLAAVAICFAITFWSYALLPVSTYFLWLIVGLLVLRQREQLVLIWVTAVGASSIAVIDGQVHGNYGSARTSGIVALLLGAVLVSYHSSQQRTGLPTSLGEAMLADLRERLQSQGRVPRLPAPWRAESSVLAAHGVWYAGDFLVAHLSEDERRLEVILVDVVGKGVGAGTEALQFQGALAGLIGSLPPRGLMEAANDFLLRQGGEETMATAAHLVIHLDTGRYVIHSAGHPPVLRWCAGSRAWVVDNARGLALGVMRRPELDASEGELAPGEALMFYTDGVIETRENDLASGVEWLTRVAARAVAPGFDGAARRILRQVERGDDDRAVLIIDRGR